MLSFCIQQILSFVCSGEHRNKRYNYIPKTKHNNIRITIWSVCIRNSRLSWLFIAPKFKILDMPIHISFADEVDGER